MSQNFQAGDYLIFQLESGYGLLRILGIDEVDGETVWHLAAYNELFPDIEYADAAVENPSSLSLSIPHIALTTRAFQSTQTARMKNVPLTEQEAAPLERWRGAPNTAVSDRSIRLMLGLR